MLPHDLYEDLIAQFVDALRLQDRADTEAYTADNASESGDQLRAEQHYRFSQTYRAKAKALREEIQQRLSAVKSEASQEVLEREARRRHYGSESLRSRPYVA